METLNSFIVFLVYLCIMELKEQLILVSTELFIKYGIKSISMDDISRQMGISKKTMYEIVDSKSDLIDLVLNRHLSQSEQKLDVILKASRDAIDEMLQLSMHVLNFIAHLSPSIIYDLQKYYPKSWKLVREYQQTCVEQRIYNNLTRGQKEMLYRTDLDPKIIAKLYVFKTGAITDGDIFPPADFDKALLYKEIIKYHLFGIISEKGLKTILRNYRKYLTI